MVWTTWSAGLGAGGETEAAEGLQVGAMGVPLTQARGDLCLPIVCPCTQESL